MYLELKRDLISVLAARPGIHIDADLELRVLPRALKRLGRARALEGEVLDVLGEHGELRLLGRVRRGLRCLRRRLGGTVAIGLWGFAFSLLFRHLGFQPSSVLASTGGTTAANFACGVGPAPRGKNELSAKAFTVGLGPANALSFGRGRGKTFLATREFLGSR